MKRELLATELCMDGHVRYYLLSDAGHYGVGVEYRGERVLLAGLTALRQRAETLLMAMARGRVTPATARDVAEDWLRSGNAGTVPEPAGTGLNGCLKIPASEQT